MALALAVGAFIVGLAPLSDGDLWWHLAAGREIVRTHALPTVDTFSSGAAGRPWIDVHWGFQLAAYLIHSIPVLGGLRALVLAKCAIVAVGALLLASAVVRAAGPRARVTFAVAFLFALFAARSLLLLRPVIPTLLFMAAFFWLLERFRAEARPLWLVPLPLLQIAWSNVQGLSMLGPALVAAYAVSTAASARWRDRSWFPFVKERAPARWAFLALVGCLAGSAATPYGLAGLALPFELLHRLVPGAGNVYAANVAENVPPWVLERGAPGQMGHLAAFLVLLAASLVSARRLALSHVIVVTALVGLALVANRNVLLLYWIGTPIAVIAACPSLRRLRIAVARARVTRTWGGPLVARWSGRLSLAGGLALAVLAAAGEPRLAEAAPFRVPAVSAEVIAARGGTGTIFAADQYGGYLIWRLAPAWKPYMDTRLVLRSAEEFAEYLALADEPARFDAWEEAHPMDYVLLPVGYPERYLRLIEHLHASDRWRLVATDGTEVLFARGQPGHEVAAVELPSIDLASRATVDGLIAQQERRFGGSLAVREAARLQLAALELAVGQPGEAEHALGGLETPASDQVRARCRLAAGDLDGARALADRSVARAPDDVAGLDVMAVIEARRGETTRAAALLRRALELDPFDAEAGRILAAWEGEHAPSR